MALSLLNYFVFDVKEARIPLMLVDGLVIYGLHLYEKKLKAEKAAREADAAQHEALEREKEKKGKNAEKIAIREQRKMSEQKTKAVNGHANFGPKNPIKQPDKSKKTR